MSTVMQGFKRYFVINVDRFVFSKMKWIFTNLSNFIIILQYFYYRRSLVCEVFSLCSMKCFQDIEELFIAFKSHNESKNIFKAARTPAVFFVIAVIAYILSGVFTLLGLYSVANTCNLVMGLSLLTLVLWSYIR